MARGNTIGRMVGQAPVSKKPPEMANPVMQMFQGLQQLQSLWQQLQGILQQLRGGGGGDSGGSAPSVSAPTAAATSDASTSLRAPEAGSSFADLSALRDQLTELGRSLRPTAASMEGPRSPAQLARLSVTDTLVAGALQIGGPSMASVHQIDLDRLRDRAVELGSSLGNPAHAAQAVEAAQTMARMRGAKAPVLQMLQQVLGMFQQALSLMQKIKPATGGAKVRE
jgi:hypothetical protein